MKKWFVYRTLENYLPMANWKRDLNENETFTKILVYKI